MISALKDEEGSYTIEAALLLPIVFITVLILIFFTMYLYQNIIVGQVATITAERAAYSWDNSYRHPRTGKFDEGCRDSLYWRLSDDGMLQAVFGLIGGESSPQEVAVPADYSGKSLPLKKMSASAKGLPSSFQGKVVYSPGLLKRIVSTDLKRLIPLSPLEKVLGKDLTQIGNSTAYIVEPTEWIRTVDLGRYYGAKLSAQRGKGAFGKDEANKVLKRLWK